MTLKLVLYQILQSYEEIVKNILAESKKTGKLCLYTDKKFPANQSSLWKDHLPNELKQWKEIVWKRINVR